MSINELEKTAFDERTIPHDGRSIEDFDSNPGDFRQEYTRARKIRKSQVAGMADSYKQYEIDRSNAYFRRLFSDIREKVLHDTTTKIGPDMWLARKTANIDGEVIKFTVAFINGEIANQAQKIHISVSGVGSHLELDENGGVTCETITDSGGRQKIASFPATIIDARFYRRVMGTF